MDVKELRDKQIPGEGGVIIPEGVGQGQAKLKIHGLEGADRAIGESIIFDSESKMGAAMSCPNCPPDPSHVTLSPGSMVGAVGDTQNVTLRLHFMDGSSKIVTNPFAVNFYPGNSSIADVTAFTVNFKSPGATSIDASADAERWEFNFETGRCDPVELVTVWSNLLQVTVTACSISMSASSPDNFLITTAPAMPVINANATVRPASATVQWSSQIIYTAPSGACSGGPAFDSNTVTGRGTTFSPSFSGFFGGALGITATCAAGISASDSFSVGGRDPGKLSIQAEIGSAGTPFDAGDLKRIACWESNQLQFLGNGLPSFGGGGDAGVFQICFQRTAGDLWNWKTNIARGKSILNSSLSFANTVPGRVRTEVVRGMGPFPNATNFTNEQARKEAIHAYNAGTNIDTDGYWQWDDAIQQWKPVPQGGAPNYVANVLAKDPSCP